jgi:hypothetical protein
MGKGLVIDISEGQKTEPYENLFCDCQLPREAHMINGLFICTICNKPVFNV